MKRILTIFGALSTLLTVNIATAACNPTANSYTSEDDNGTKVSLVYSCSPKSKKISGELCIYKDKNSNGKLIAAINGDVNGQGLSSSDLTRQKVTETASQLKIELKTPVLESLLNAQKFVLSLNKKSKTGSFTYNIGTGIDPFTGNETKEDITVTVTCK